MTCLPLIGRRAKVRPLVPLLLASCLASLAAGRAAGQVADVVRAFAEIPTQGKLIAFRRDAFELPPGGHLQGVQMRFDAVGKRDLAFLSHDSASVAYLLVVAFPADLATEGRIVHVHTFPGDGRSPPLRHAGGIQLLEDVLVVGLEDNQQKTRSEVQFWDVADPTKPVQLEHLTIRRTGPPKDKTAGAVGIVRRAGDHLVAVANWDSRAIDFYASNGKPLKDAACRFEFRARWTDVGADKTNWEPDRLFGAYQAVNLAADTDGSLFVIGFGTSGERDLAELFALDMSQPPSRLFQKRASKTMRLDGGDHFRHAGGLSNVAGRWTILASPRNLADETRLEIFR